MCMPPSKRIRTRATVTMRWSARIDSEPRAGKRSAQTDAATRKMAGVGMRTHSLIRLEPTAANSASAATTTTRAKGTTSCTWAPGVGDRSADQTSRHSVAHCIGTRPTSSGVRRCSAVLDAAVRPGPRLEPGLPGSARRRPRTCRSCRPRSAGERGVPRRAWRGDAPGWRPPPADRRPSTCPRRRACRTRSCRARPAAWSAPPARPRAWPRVRPAAGRRPRTSRQGRALRVERPCGTSG